MNFLSKISFDKLKGGLTKTKNSLISKIEEIIRISPSIDDQTFEKIEEALLSADVGVGATERILSNAKDNFKNVNDLFFKSVKNELLKILNDAENGSDYFNYQEFNLKNVKTPFVILIAGVNGTGKTTSIGKISHNFIKNGYSVIIAAADTFRAAANEQLEIWAKRSGARIVQQKQGADPGAVVYEALSFAETNKIDIVLVDTAGRLHTKSPLMMELKKIQNVIYKKLNRSADETFLIIDASTGQNAIHQINEFSKFIDTTGIILTKLDGTAKGGIIFQICNDKKIPVRYIGVGEGIEDLQPFDPKTFVDALFSN
ncbi:MAG: signal recognition particle-docking protein FtsY [Ignavibacteria bacterium]|nr:signal recognition particle-docking protein FtsY [Ignavibacteria bacterium]